MDFFEKFDFFHFQLFDVDCTVILEENFTMGCWGNGTFWFPHTHETWEIYFVNRGTVGIDCNTRRIPISEKQFMFIPPDTVHNIVYRDDDSDFGCMRFTFQSDTAGTMGHSIKSLLLQSGLTPIIANDEAVSSFSALRSIYREYTVQKDVKFWILPKVASLCCYFVSSMMESAFEVPTTLVKNNSVQMDMRAMIVEFFMYCTMGAPDDFTISDLAKNLNYSVSQTNRMLQQLFGKSFRTMIKETRLRKAKYILQRSDLPIDKIAELLGYSETKNFSKAFKEVEGITPLQFRAQCQNINE